MLGANKLSFLLKLIWSLFLSFQYVGFFKMCSASYPLISSLNIQDVVLWHPELIVLHPPQLLGPSPLLHCPPSLGLCHSSAIFQCPRSSSDTVHSMLAFTQRPELIFKLLKDDLRIWGFEDLSLETKPTYFHRPTVQLLVHLPPYKFWTECYSFWYWDLWNLSLTVLPSLWRPLFTDSFLVLRPLSSAGN